MSKSLIKILTILALVLPASGFAQTRNGEIVCVDDRTNREAIITSGICPRGTHRFEERNRNKYEPREGLYRGWEKTFLPPAPSEVENKKEPGTFDSLLDPAPYQRTGIIDFGPSDLQKQQWEARKKYYALTDPLQKAKFLTQFPGASPEQIAAAKELQNTLEASQRTQTLQSAAVKKARAANKPDDIIILESLDASDSAHLKILIGYIQTGTINLE